LIKGAKQILSEQQFTQFGSDGQAREEVMAMERVLLQTIKFDFNIEHPYKYIIQVSLHLREYPLASKVFSQANLKILWKKPTCLLSH
jgi:hypothetical protein